MKGAFSAKLALAVFLSSGCSGGSNTPEASNVTEGDAKSAASTEDARPQPPAEINVDLSDKSLLSLDPDVYPSDDVPEGDLADLLDLIRASVAVIKSQEFLENARTLSATYPQIYFNRKWGSHEPRWGAEVLRNPRQTAWYHDTQVMIEPERSGAITGRNRDRVFRMAINRLPLTNWQSTDRVRRSCAINTVAHEITHTLIRSSDGGVAFTDGDTGADTSRRNGTTASYVLGQLAQCTWLQQQGRITAADVPACVPVFYDLSEQTFANNRCDDYPDGTRVVLSNGR